MKKEEPTQVIKVEQEKEKEKIEPVGEQDPKAKLKKIMF
jgi:hypothetical protein